MKDEQEQKTENRTQIGDDSPVSAELTMPRVLKFGLAFVFGGPALFVMVLLARYSLRADAKPSEFGLGTVLIFCLTGLAVVLIPWGILGVRLKKIGPLEFEQVINTQKKEQSESVTFLQNQIDELKQSVGTSPRVESFESFKPGPSVALPTLLERFLRNYPRRFFSPFTIISWGGKQSGFKELDSFSKTEITQTLLNMLATNQVQTKISKKGNTLYGIRP